MAEPVVSYSLLNNFCSLEKCSSQLLDQLTQWNLNNNTGIIQLTSVTPPEKNGEKLPTEQSWTDWDKADLEALEKLSSTVVRLVKIGSKGCTLAELKQLLTPIRGVPKSQQLNDNLYRMSVQYAIVLLYQITLNKLLKSTIPLNNELFYWELTSSTSWRTALYALQTFPSRLTRLFSTVVEDLRPRATSTMEWRQWVHEVTKSVYSNLVINNVRGFTKFVGLSTATPGSLSKMGISYTKIILGSPFMSILHELHCQVQDTQQVHRENAIELGKLLKSLPKDVTLLDDEGCVETINKFNDVLGFLQGDGTDPVETLLQTLEQLPQLFDSWRLKLSHVQRPSLLTRYWPTILLSLLYGPSTIISIVSNRDAIVEFFTHSVWGTITGFYSNWILKPTMNILQTIRHDDNSEISIMSQRSLSSDLDSLKRMVIEYTVENSSEYKNLSNEELSNLTEHLDKMVSTGDLTPLMKNYESDIKHPLKSTISGTLPRALLIQLQKTKVDGAVAMSGIDKLLKSQELVFGIVAASPSLLVLVYTFDALKSYIRRGYVMRNVAQKKVQISRVLNNVEMLLIQLQELDQQSELLDEINGSLVLELVSLRQLGMLLVPSYKQKEWIRDINDLIDTDKLKTRLYTVTRIYHVYGTFFQ